NGEGTAKYPPPRLRPPTSRPTPSLGRRMFRRGGHRFADKNMRQTKEARANSDSEGTGICSGARACAAHATALSLLVGTDAIVFRICEAIWYGSPWGFGRRSSR